MAVDSVVSFGGDEFLCFGPLSGYGTEELGRRGLDPNKKSTKGFKRFSQKGSDALYQISKDKEQEDFSRSEHQGQEQGQIKGQSSTGKEDVRIDIPTWEEFIQTTTFHGIKYIFGRSPHRFRRYFE